MIIMIESVRDNRFGLKIIYATLFTSLALKISLMDSSVGINTTMLYFSSKLSYIKELFYKVWAIAWAFHRNLVPPALLYKDEDCERKKGVFIVPSIQVTKPSKYKVRYSDHFNTGPRAMISIMDLFSYPTILCIVLFATIGNE